MNPDQTAPTGAVWSGSSLFVYDASNILLDDKNIHFVIMRFMSSVCFWLGFSWNAQATYLFLSLADEIAEARPDMNIKVAAFTVSEKSINIGTGKFWTYWTGSSEANNF